MAAYDIQENYKFSQKFWAWSVHLFTGSGAVVGLLTIFAIIEHNWLLVIIWMTVSAAIDALDGTLARRAQVKGVLPTFDGALLDNIVDYFTYAIIPALLVYEAGLLPPGWAELGASIIVLTSGYQFCQEDAKTDDHYFKGFPSYWNVVVYYMLFLNTNPTGNLITIIIFGILVFVPIKFIYPTRTIPFQKLTMGLAILWAVIQMVIILQYPDFSRPFMWSSLWFIAYYIGISLYLMAKGEN